jgi:hypothetical protein
MFIAEPLEDPPGRMPLLRWCLPVSFQQLMDGRQEPLQLGLGPGLAQTVARRLRLGKDLLQRLPTKTILLNRRAATQLARQYALARRPRISATFELAGRVRSCRNCCWSKSPWHAAAKQFVVGCISWDLSGDGRVRLLARQISSTTKSCGKSASFSEACLLMRLLFSKMKSTST